MSEHFVRFDSDVFRIFLEGLQRTFLSAGDSMVFQMSKDFSIQAMMRIGKQLGVDLGMKPEQIINLFAARMKESGWGEFKPVKMDFDDYKFEVELTDSPYQDLLASCNSIMSFFYRGVLCGFFEYLTRRPLRIQHNETINENGALTFHICE